MTLKVNLTLNRAIRRGGCRRPGPGGAAGGFTLIEVLISLVVLGYITIYVFNALFTSLSAIETAENRLSALRAMNDNVNDLKSLIVAQSIKIPYRHTGFLYENDMRYEYTIGAVPLKSKKLCKISVLYHWYRGNKLITVSRTAFYPIPPAIVR